ncbi:MAG: alpha/beta hydrolase family protein [Roseibacillus sp.]
MTTKLTSFSYGEREVPLKVYLPESEKAAPVVLLSHGLGGSREVGSFLGEQWASRGFVVVAMQHVGSDDSVWKEERVSRRRSKLTAAANGQTFQDRMRDVPATLDQLEKWQLESGHFLEGRMDLEKVGIGGHSYGAKTVQALAGQTFGRLGKLYHDERIDAALALSPSPPRMGGAEKAFGQISLPMMLMTGTKDGSPIGSASPEERREVFPALSEGEKFQLVLKDAEHHAFSDTGMRGQKQNPNHHLVIQGLSTAFWEAYLTESEEAQQWLESQKPKEIMEEGDLWQKK